MNKEVEGIQCDCNKVKMDFNFFSDEITKMIDKLIETSNGTKNLA